MSYSNRSNHQERGAALGIALLLTMVFSTLLIAALLTTRGQAPMSQYHTASTKAYYLAETGVKKSALWFTRNFSADPSQAGKFILPMKDAASNSNSSGCLKYVDPQGTVTDYDYSKPPVAVTEFDHTLTSVKVTDLLGRLRNVVLSANGLENTYPESYTVKYGNAASRTINDVVSSFASQLGNPQQEKDGSWSVKAMLVALNPPNETSDGTIVWRITSTGRTPDGAEKTIVAELSAVALPYTESIPRSSSGAGFPGGILSRGSLRIDKKATVDSYRSDLGEYNDGLTTGSFAGQVGDKNIGRNGDLHSNGFGKKGIIIVKSESIVQGDAGIVTSYNGPDNGKADPIREEKKGDVTGNKNYSARWKDFYDISPVPQPSPESPDYKTTKGFEGTLPAGSYHNVEVLDDSELAIPGGTYSQIRAHKGSTVILGTPGVTSRYNLSKLKLDRDVKVIINGPVIFNIQRSFKYSANMEIAEGLRPNDIHFNVQDDHDKKNDLDVEYDDDDGDGLDEDVFVDDGDTKGGKVKIQKGKFYGVVYAPGSKVDIKNGADFYGAVVGYQVKIKQNTKIHVDESLVNWVPDPGDNTPLVMTRGFSAYAFALRYK